ncbi:MAG: hypothetical protein JWM98_772 [Thermoleophilia bacterium]|nr:hypothetical protein [Thermoleophilia bacterium]
MTLHKRILDMLPALLVFAFVSVFASYVAVAYIVHDPMWLRALAELQAQHPGASADPSAPGAIGPRNAG